MLDGSEDETIKVIIVGDGYTGKTSLLRRFVRGDFTDQYRKTIGAEFLEKDVYLRSSDTTVKLMLWDTAGQEVFNSLTQAYYRGAGAAVLVFSTTDRDSFGNVGKWKERVEAVCGPITMVLCQSKFDLSYEAAITNEEAEGLAKELKIPFYRVSSKDDFNVIQLFEFTAQQCLSAASEADGDQEEERSPAGTAAAAAAPAVPLHEEEEGSGAIPASGTASDPVVPKPQDPASTSPGAGPSGEAKATATIVASPASSSPTPSAPPPPPAAASSSAPAAAAAAASATAGANKRKEEGNSRKVSLKEQDAAAAASTTETTKKKKKRRCTML